MNNIFDQDYKNIDRNEAKLVDQAPRNRHLRLGRQEVSIEKGHYKHVNLNEHLKRMRINKSKNVVSRMNTKAHRPHAAKELKPNDKKNNIEHDIWDI